MHTSPRPVVVIARAENLSEAAASITQTKMPNKTFGTANKNPSIGTQIARIVAMHKHIKTIVTNGIIKIFKTTA